MVKGLFPHHFSFLNTLEGGRNKFPGNCGKDPLEVEMNQLILLFQNSQAYKMSYWAISSSSVGWRRPPVFSPLLWSRGSLFLLRSLETASSGDCLGWNLLMFVWRGPMLSCPPWAMSQVLGLSGIWEPHSPPAGNTEGRIVEGEGLWQWISSHRAFMGEGADDKFISLSFLCTGHHTQAG